VERYVYICGLLFQWDSMTQSDCIHVHVHPPFVCLLKIYWLRASACVIAYSMQSYMYIVYRNMVVGFTTTHAISAYQVLLYLHKWSHYYVFTLLYYIFFNERNIYNSYHLLSLALYHRETIHDYIYCHLPCHALKKFVKIVVAMLR
jgi:hypothetical protein